jgi:hypothetical protein
VRVRALAITSSNTDQAPKRIKLLVNRPSIGFEDVEGAEGPAVAQVVDLTKDGVREGQKIALRFVRFQNVNSLHVSVKTPI